VLDPRFADIVAKEFDVLSDIHRFLGLPFTDAIRARVNERFNDYIRRYAAYLD
jgi:hypothetical protein